MAQGPFKLMWQTAQQQEEIPEEITLSIFSDAELMPRKSLLGFTLLFVADGITELRDLTARSVEGSTTALQLSMRPLAEEGTMSLRGVTRRSAVGTPIMPLAQHLQSVEDS